MNTKQKIILWCGAIVICFMIAFPPWLYIDRTAHYTVTKDYGYAFITTPATGQESLGLASRETYTQEANAINMGRLGLQIAIVAILTGTGIATVGRQQRRDE